MPDVSIAPAKIPAEKIGKTYAPKVYAVGREKIREFAHAVGETNPLYLDLEVARAAGHSDLVAPPMFAVVYGRDGFTEALFDPELAVNFTMLVHASQSFRWDGPLVVAGDEITTEVLVNDISEKAGLRFYVFQTTSVNQRGEVVCVGTWTVLIRADQ